jgi:trehalose-phosphatase
MKYLFDDLKSIFEKIRESEHLFLLSDFDGTLTPIVSHPEEAWLSGAMKRLLAEFARLPDTALAIISGRSLRDLRGRIGLKGVSYAGNHGLEIFEPGKGIKRFIPEQVVHELRKLRDRLKSQWMESKGAFIEDKGCILAVHYRNVEAKWVPPLLSNLGMEIGRSSLFYLSQGKKVFEVRPRCGIHKGTAVLELLNGSNGKKTLPIYIGDDQTDEDAFRALGRLKGVTVHVGREGYSRANYFVKDHTEVHRFLRMVQEQSG